MPGPWTLPTHTHFGSGSRVGPEADRMAHNKWAKWAESLKPCWRCYLLCRSGARHLRVGTRERQNDQTDSARSMQAMGCEMLLLFRSEE